MVEGYQNLFQQTAQSILSGIRSCLAGHGIDPDSVTGLSETCLNYPDPFLGLENEYKQKKILQRKNSKMIDHNFELCSCQILQ